MRRTLSELEIFLKRKIIQDWNAISKEEMFLYALENRFLHFYHVDADDIVEFCRFCIDHHLLSFTKQKEYGGSAAELQVLKDFNVQWKPTSLTRNRPTYTMKQDDALILTEFLNDTPKKRGMMNLYDEWRVEVDIPTDDTRLTFYENARRILCG